MAIDWSMARQPNVLAMALDGYEQGRQLRREEKSRNALAVLLGGGAQASSGTPPIAGLPSQNTGGVAIPTLDPILSPGGGIGGGRSQGGDMVPMGGSAPSGIDYSALTREDLRTAITIQGHQREQQQAQAKQRGDQMQQLGRLLNHATDETTYQQSLAAAKQIGLDVSSAPPSFDPNWVNQQKLVLQAFEKDGGQALTAEARNLVQLGYKLGTPEFQQALAQAVNAGFAKPYTGEGGETRLYSPNIAVPAQMAPQQTPAQPRKPVSMQAAMDVVRQAGPKAAEFVRNNGFAVQVTTPDEARQLPSGTPIILPDGSEGVVP